MAMKSKWQILEPDPKIIQRIKENLNCSTISATILANREIKTPEEAISFLNPSFEKLQLPFYFEDNFAPQNR